MLSNASAWLRATLAPAVRVVRHLKSSWPMALAVVMLAACSGQTSPIPSVEAVKSVGPGPIATSDGRPNVEGDTAADSADAQPPAFVPTDAAGWTLVDIALSDEASAIADRIGNSMALDGVERPSADRIAALMDSALLSMGVSWTHEIAPWSTGRVGGWVQAVDGPGFEASSIFGTIGIEVGDQARLTTFLDGLRAGNDGSADIDIDEYSGVEILALTLQEGGTPVLLAQVDGWLLVGATDGSLHLAIDASNGTHRMADTEVGRVGEGSAAAASAWLDLRSYVGLILADETNRNRTDDILSSLGLDLTILPETAAGWLDLDGGGLAVQLGLHGDSNAFVPQPRATTLAERMPPDSLLYLEVHDVAVAGDVLRRWRADTGYSDSGYWSSPLDALGYYVGLEPDAVLAQLRDVAMSITLDMAGTLQVGLAADLVDVSEAEQLAKSLALAMRTIQNRDADLWVDVGADEVAGVAVTRYNVSALGNVASQGLPIDTTISLAINNGQLLLGTGSFVDDAILRNSGDSLATQERFQEDTVPAGTPTLAVGFLDVNSGWQAIQAIVGRDPYMDSSVRSIIESLDTVGLVVTGGAGELTATVRATLALE